jgi:hypothetical protein
VRVGHTAQKATRLLLLLRAFGNTEGLRLLASLTSPAGMGPANHHCCSVGSVQLPRIGNF